MKGASEELAVLASFWVCCDSGLQMLLARKSLSETEIFRLDDETKQRSTDFADENLLNPFLLPSFFPIKYF